MAAPGFYNAADQALYDQGNYFLPQEQYRLNLGTDTGAPNRVEFNPSTAEGGIGSLPTQMPYPYYGQEGGDDDDDGLPPGPKGVGSLFDRYNKAGYLGRNLINMPIGMLVPPLAPLLGMYNMGRSAYDGISGLLGGLKTTGFGNFTGGFLGAPEGRDEYGKPMNVGDVESGLSGLGGSYSGTAAQQEALMSEMSSGHGGSNDPSNTSGGFGGDDDE